MPAVVQTEPIDTAAEYKAVRDRLAGKSGAIVTFSGLMREIGPEGPLSSMTLEHYPGMTKRELEQIAEQARTRWSLDEVVVVHRYGALEPGDEIVAVVTAAAHRADAFAAAEFVMDFLKTRAPFWKKETSAEGKDHWVDARATDDSAAARWRKK